MQIEQGMIVKSIAGHDQNRFYVVIKTEGDFAYIADGKLRTLSKPKRKRQIHLKKTNNILDAEKLDTDKKLRDILWKFNYGNDKL